MIKIEELLKVFIGKLDPGVQMLETILYKIGKDRYEILAKLTVIQLYARLLEGYLVQR